MCANTQDSKGQPRLTVRVYLPSSLKQQHYWSVTERLNYQNHLKKQTLYLRPFHRTMKVLKQCVVCNQDWHDSVFQLFIRTRPYMCNGLFWQPPSVSPCLHTQTHSNFLVSGGGAVRNYKTNFLSRGSPVYQNTGWHAIKQKGTEDTEQKILVLLHCTTPK